MSDYTKGEQKKCNKHGYYWVGLCCNGQIANDICPGCLIAAAPDLLLAHGEIHKVTIEAMDDECTPKEFRMYERIHLIATAAIKKTNKR